MPIPKRRKGESLEEWRSRIISLETRAGKPPKQAQAIGYSVTGTAREEKAMLTVGFAKQQPERWATIRGKRVPIRGGAHESLGSRSQPERPSPTHRKAERLWNTLDRMYWKLGRVHSKEAKGKPVSPHTKGTIRAAALRGELDSLKRSIEPMTINRMSEDELKSHMRQIVSRIDVMVRTKLESESSNPLLAQLGQALNSGARSARSAASSVGRQ